MRTFDKSYLQIARVWSQNSRAIRAKVGAIIVKDNMIISDGFNGTPSGFENECEDIIGCSLYKPGQHRIMCNTKEDYSDCSLECPYAILKTKPYVLHAEANAITKLAKSGNSADGSTLYVSMSPCMECAKLIIQAGIKRVVYEEEYRDRSGLDLLKRANIIVEQIKAN